MAGALQLETVAGVLLIYIFANTTMVCASDQRILKAKGTESKATSKEQNDEKNDNEQKKGINK